MADISKININGTDYNIKQPTSLPASDVYAWAKASSKPTYTASEVGAASSYHTHNYYPWYTAVVDLSNTSVYHDNTWYPVVGYGIPKGGMHRFVLAVQLDQNVPSWSTHDGGFTVNIDVLATSSGWGTTGSASIILNDFYRYTYVNPAAYLQLYESSTPVFMLRGGGKYPIKTDYECNWTPVTSTFQPYNESVSPTTTPPVSNIPRTEIWANLYGNVRTSSGIELY